MPSEKLFSKAGEVIAARRSNIKPKNVDMILFLNKNLLCFGIVQWFIEIFVCLGEGGSIIMVWYRIVSVYHVNTQYRIESPLPGIAHL